MIAKMTPFSTDSTRRAMKTNAVSWKDSPAQYTLWKEGACVIAVVLPVSNCDFGREASCSAEVVGAGFQAPVRLP